MLWPVVDGRYCGAHVSALSTICNSQASKENQKSPQGMNSITYSGVILSKSLSSGGTFESGFLFTAVAAAAILKLIFAARDQSM